MFVVAMRDLAEGALPEDKERTAARSKERAALGVSLPGCASAPSPTEAGHVRDGFASGFEATGGVRPRSKIARKEELK